MNAGIRIKKFLPGVLYRAARLCGSEAERAGFNAYLVGGSVRDVHLGIRCIDIDVCFEPPAGWSRARIHKSITALYRKIAAKAGSAGYKFYGDFSTAKLPLAGGYHIDLALTRSEIYRKSGALPEIMPSDIRNDEFRRDFTINSMAVVLNPCSFGCLVDFYGGLKDLRGKCLRIIHSRSFADDPTRALRCLRLSARLGFMPEAFTESALRRAVRGNYFANVSRKRLISEFFAGLREKRASEFLKSLPKYGISYNIFCFDGKALRGAIKKLDSPVDVNYRIPVRLSLILGNYGSEKAKELLKCMKVERRLMNGITAALRFRETGMGTALPEWALAYYALTGFSKKWRGITGRDLISLGLTPGPHFLKILSHVNFPGRFSDRKSALRYVKKWKISTRS